MVQSSVWRKPKVSNEKEGKRKTVRFVWIFLVHLRWIQFDASDHMNVSVLHKSVVIICISFCSAIRLCCLALNSWCVITTEPYRRPEPGLRKKIEINKKNKRCGTQARTQARSTTTSRKVLETRFFPFFIPFIYYVLFAVFFSASCFFSATMIFLFYFSSCARYTNPLKVNLNSSIIQIIDERRMRTNDGAYEMVFNNMETTTIINII